MAAIFNVAPEDRDVAWRPREVGGNVLVSLQGSARLWNRSEHWGFIDAIRLFT